MPKTIRSAYEVALERKLKSPSENENSHLDGFFVDDRPSKILGSRAKHPGLPADKKPREKPEVKKPVKKPPKKEQVEESFEEPVKETIKERKSLDMNAYISCNVTLSNKLLKLIKDGSTASLFMGPFKGNKASGHLRFETLDTNFNELKSLSSTSLMIEMLEFGEDVPEIGNDKPIVSFGTSPLKLIDKVAITEPRKHVANLSKQPKTQKVSDHEKKAAISAAINRAKAPKTQVSSYEELVAACNQIPGIDSVAVSIKKPKNGNRFTRAEAMEYEKEIMSLPKLQQSVFIKNNHPSRIEIGDISMGENSLILAPFEVFDLSRLSGRIVRDSSHLRSLIMSKSKFVSFVGREEYEEWMNEKTESSFTTGYKAYSGEHASEKAAETMYDDISDMDEGESKTIIGKKAVIDERAAMEVTEEELESPIPFDSEETTNILKSMPKERSGNFTPAASPVRKPSESQKSIRRV